MVVVGLEAAALAESADRTVNRPIRRAWRCKHCSMPFSIDHNIAQSFVRAVQCGALLVDSTSLRAWVGEFVCYEVTRQREAVERSGQVTRKSERGRSRAEVHTLGAGGACYWVSVSREAFGSSTDADAGARGNYRQLSERGERAA
jgi:hypothetical protein